MTQKSKNSHLFVMLHSDNENTNKNDKREKLFDHKPLDDYLDLMHQWKTTLIQISVAPRQSSQIPKPKYSGIYITQHCIQVSLLWITWSLFQRNLL